MRLFLHQAPCGLFFHLIYPSPTGLTDAEVTQTPRYLVKRKGEKVFIECLQDMDHEKMTWYRQDPALGLQQLYFSYGTGSTEKGDDVPEGYSVSREKKEAFSLTMESAGTNQTAVYLCASSESTVLQSHILSHKKGRCQREVARTRG